MTLLRWQHVLAPAITRPTLWLYPTAVYLLVDVGDALLCSPGLARQPEQFAAYVTARLQYVTCPFCRVVLDELLERGGVFVDELTGELGLA